MSVNRLPDGLKLGPITLSVAGLKPMVDFYRDGVGLEVLGKSQSEATLGFAGGGTPIEVVKLTLQPELKPDNRAAAGLYHLAILFPTRSALAAAVNSVAHKYPTAFSGSADHLVSEAFYFTDPEGNGVELYWDREISEWPRNGDFIRMDTLPLDPNAFLQEHLLTDEISAARGLAPETPSSATRSQPFESPILGHVHLRVGDLAQAEDFYVAKVGFDKTFQFGNQALFVSAGGYHHHLGMNTWQSAGAGARTPSLGLSVVEIALPTSSDITDLKGRLTAAEVATTTEGEGFTFLDPWLNAIRVTTN